MSVPRQDECYEGQREDHDDVSEKVVVESPAWPHCQEDGLTNRKKERNGSDSTDIRLLRVHFHLAQSAHSSSAFAGKECFAAKRHPRPSSKIGRSRG